jgi:hypothetical protein
MLYLELAAPHDEALLSHHKHHLAAHPRIFIARALDVAGH